MGVTYTVGVTSVAAQENSLIQGILIRDSLANRVDRIPFHMLPLDRVRLQNLLGGSLYLCFGGCLSWAPVGIRGRRYLDVEANHVVLTRDDHDGAMLAAYRTLHLQ